VTATARELEYAEAVKVHGTTRAAAEALGVNHTTVWRALDRMRERLSGQRKDDGSGKRILVLPDVQAKPGIDFSFLSRIGQYALDKRPDVIVCIGDFADMPSLSSYDKGKKSFEGRRYKRDIEAAQFAMQAFLAPIEDYNKTAKRPYKPRMVMTLGNHEERILRAINDDAKLDGVLSVDDLAYKEYGWEVYPFLEVVIIEGVAFAHYFATGVMGRAASSAAAQLRVANMSCFAGHQQGKQIAYAKRADGAILTSIISGSCYEHDEGFLGPQVNKQHWRGFFMLHDTKNGTFDEMPVSIGFINQRYGHISYTTPAYSMPTEAEFQAGRM
jgi:hypothetical protein